MARVQISTKKIKIDKANATMVGVTAAAAFIVTFSLIASRALINKSSYQNRVIKEKKSALKLLKTNVKNAETLKKKYVAFENEPENIIAGNPKGTGPRDGDNARIVLDALPSKYDYPALASSIEKILKDGGFSVGGISGTDDPVTQAADKAEIRPKPIEMPFPLNVSGTYVNMQKMTELLERSIRPIQIDSIGLSGSDSNIALQLKAKTYFQPEKSLKVSTKVVK